MATIIPDMPLVESVFHPTDFSPASGNAFAHALAIAILRQTKLTILNAGADPRLDETWTSFPQVRETLQRWGLLGEGSGRSAVFDELSLRVRKVAVLGGRKPLSAILGYLDQHPTDLIVLATRGREGMPRWIQRSVSEPLARRSKTMTLFVPREARGFVSEQDGSFSLRRVLLPVDHHPSAEAAVQFVTRAAQVMGQGTVEITLLHVGQDSEMPELSLPEGERWSWSTVRQAGPVVERIVEAANELSVDLVAMVTAGREGILDALRGSTTEQVLRQISCPLLAVPTAWIDDVADDQP